MSLQPAIPWRVALQQSPTPLHRLSTILKEKQRLEQTITLNGNCVFGKLSHSRGSPQYSVGPEQRRAGPANDFDVIDQIEIQRKLCADECAVEDVVVQPMAVQQEQHPRVVIPRPEKAPHSQV